MYKQIYTSAHIISDRSYPLNSRDDFRQAPNSLCSLDLDGRIRSILYMCLYYKAELADTDAGLYLNASKSTP